MNGFELARALYKEPGLEKIRLIALTGWGTEQDRGQVCEAGFDVHLSKPVSIDARRVHVAGPVQLPGLSLRSYRQSQCACSASTCLATPRSAVTSD